ncbi:MAG: HEPN domain-containing protein [Oscillatoria sp. PMC 1068.18]|nr:HEPN domain-containing protein [Oscillatoria sp. PMC 1076.18]MEC4991060.1 HEPN domain-containing protein [Oscillatoria sp. PMC 1068.18]
MTFNWLEYLILAQKLAGTRENPANEAEMRSAISRAYYAAMIQSRNFLFERDKLLIPTQNTHQYVMNQYRNSSNKNRKKIGERLRRLRGYRNQADYDDTVKNLSNKTQEALTLARRIISGLDSL